jgi:hypothetical protein
MHVPERTEEAQVSQPKRLFLTPTWVPTATMQERWVLGANNRKHTFLRQKAGTNEPFSDYLNEMIAKPVTATPD